MQVNANRSFRQVSSTIFLVVLAVACGTQTPTAENEVLNPLAITTTYYVDNRSGSGCNNAAAGTSPSAPWCDFAPANARTFTPGEQLLLARGATWNQQLSLNGSGNASSPINLGAYGSGARPRIIRNGQVADRAVRMNNPSYWNVSDLEVGNAGEGIQVNFTTLFHEGLNFSNIYAHDIRGIHQGNRFTTGNINCTTTDGVWNSAGLGFTMAQTLSFTSSQYVLRNVRISNFEGTRNLSSISFDFCNGRPSSDGTAGANLVQNAVLDGLYLHDDNGPAEGCDEGLRLVNLQNSMLMNSRLEREGGCASATGTIAVIIGRTQNLMIVNSSITDTPDTASPDQGGLDFEFGNVQTKVRGVYIAENAGPGVELLAIYPPPNENTNIEISSSGFVNNGKANRGGYVGGINQFGGQIVPSGVIRDNLHIEPAGFLVAASGGTFSAFTQTNNRAASNLSASGKEFGSVQGTGGWSYQSGNGSGWQNMVFDAASDLWRVPSGSVPQVKRFEQHPGVGGDVAARVWTAGSAGTVSVRGRVLKSDVGGGDGITARITKNGGVIWGPQNVAFNDNQGFDTNVDGVSVAPGDVIRFEVSSGGNNAYDQTSWAPMVGYISTNGGGGANLWDFTGGFDGWSLTNQLTGSASGGVLNLNSSGGDPYMLSPDNLNVSASSFNAVTARLKNGTSSTIGRVFFTTTASPNFDATKSVAFTLIANDGAYTTYAAEMSSNPSWTGTIKQLRLDPSEGSGAIHIDYVQLVQPATRWGFDTGGNFEGWNLANQLSGNVSGGSLNLTSGGTDPYMYSSAQNFSSNGHRSITIRMKHTTSANVAQIYFITGSDGTFNDAKSANIAVVPNDSSFRTYTVEMSGISGWNGTITQLRLDPSMAGGSVTIDSIQVN
jgi:hypothetical protein